jgi:hypothetical protein
MRFVMSLAAAMTVTSGLAAASDEQLDGASLRKAVAGKTISLETPIGNVPIAYRSDGTMRSSAAGLAHYLGSTQDRGVWWVAADKLCQRWNTWLSGKPYCFTLRQSGRLVHWTRNDGVSGTATIRR